MPSFKTIFMSGYGAPFLARNGLSHDCVVACDHITTIPVDALGEQIGLLLEDQERHLTEAIHAAFALD